MSRPFLPDRCWAVPILYNSRGIAGQPGVDQIQDWNGLVYVRTSDLDSTGKLKPGVPVEPLVLRANAGDCIEVTLRNSLPTGAMNAGRTVEMIGRSSAQNVNINTSHEVGLHAQLVSYDVTQANGVNVGLNPSTTIAPGQSTTFRWYAGSMEPDSTGKVVPTPIEFGAISLSPADPLMQHPYGLVGGLIVEPLGATWKEDSNSRASATITMADGTKFREFVAVFQDDLAALRFGPKAKPGAVAPPPGTVPSGVTSAVNYRTEPPFYRFVDQGWSDNTLAEAAKGGMFQALSDSLVGADPQTPVFAAAAGVPVRMRMLHPAGTAEETITLHGHFWQEEPYTNGSTQMGNNPKSQATGSRDTFGANAEFDILLNHAGGAFETPGDYLYRTFIGNDFMSGMWGLLRVGGPQQDIVKVIRFERASAPCPTAPPNPGAANCIVVTGVNTVNTGSGQMGKQVTISGVQGSTETPLGTATVDPLSGAWQLQASVASVPTTVKAVSDGGGSAVSGPRSAQSGKATLINIMRQRQNAKQQDQLIIDNFRPPVFNEADNPPPTTAAPNPAPPPKPTPK